MTTIELAEVSRTEHFKKHLEFVVQETQREIRRLEEEISLTVDAETVRRNQKALAEARRELEKVAKAEQLNFDPDVLQDILSCEALPIRSFKEFHGFGMTEFTFKPAAKNPSTDIILRINPWDRMLRLSADTFIGSYEEYEEFGLKKQRRETDSFLLLSRVASIEYETTRSGERLARFFFEEDSLGDVRILPWAIIWSSQHHKRSGRAGCHIKLRYEPKEVFEEKSEPQEYGCCVLDY